MSACTVWGNPASVFHDIIRQQSNVLASVSFDGALCTRLVPNGHPYSYGKRRPTPRSYRRHCILLGQRPPGKTYSLTFVVRPMPSELSVYRVGTTQPKAMSEYTQIIVNETFE